MHFTSDEIVSEQNLGVAYSLQAESAMLMEDVWMCLLPILIVQALLDITFIEGQHCCFSIWRQSRLPSHAAWACGWWIWTSIDGWASSQWPCHADETPKRRVEWWKRTASCRFSEPSCPGTTTRRGPGQHKARWPTWPLRYTEEWALKLRTFSFKHMLNAFGKSEAG